jgi:hypothetical protein
LTDCLDAERLKLKARQAKSFVRHCNSESWKDLPFSVREQITQEYSTKLFSSTCWKDLPFDTRQRAVMEYSTQIFSSSSWDDLFDIVKRQISKEYLKKLFSYRCWEDVPLSLQQQVAEKYSEQFSSMSWNDLPSVLRERIALEYSKEMLSTKWCNLPPVIRRQISVEYSTNLFSSIFAKAILLQCKAGEKFPANLDRMSDCFTQFTKVITMGSRDWYLKNPNRTPRGVPHFYGKKDHTTMACYMVPGEEEVPFVPTLGHSRAACSSSPY